MSSFSIKALLKQLLHLPQQPNASTAPAASREAMFQAALSSTVQESSVAEPQKTAAEKSTTPIVLRRASISPNTSPIFFNSNLLSQQNFFNNANNNPQQDVSGDNSASSRNTRRKSITIAATSTTAMLLSSATAASVPVAPSFPSTVAPGEDVGTFLTNRQQQLSTVLRRKAVTSVDFGKFKLFGGLLEKK